jgi:hypothetical protein
VLRASIAAEVAGVPSVSLVCEGFVGQARATGEGLGFAMLPCAVLVGHVDSQSYEEMIAGFVATTIDQVVAGLSGGADAGAVVGGAEVDDPAPRDIVLLGTFAQVNEAFVERGWSDGLPFAPPTVAAVEAFLRHCTRSGDESLGIVRPSGRDMTVWSVAVNGVMGGCTPAQMPVLLALAEVIADPGYGVEHSGNTTGADALIIMNGPSKAALGFNHGQGALRDGYQANTSVGRFWRLMLRNICGFLPGEHDKATFGNSFKVVLAEDDSALEEIGWQPFSSRFGFGRTDDVVTVARYNSGAIIGSVKGSTPHEVLPYLADGLVRITGWDLAHVYGLGYGQYRPLLVLSPMIARMIAAARWSQDDLRQALFEHARIPAHKFEKFIVGWTNFVPGGRTLVDLVNFRKLPKIFAESSDPDRLVPIVLDASCIDIAVAGDPFRANAFVFSSDGPHGFPTAKRINFVH